MFDGLGIWLGRWVRLRPRSQARRRPGFRPLCEVLEDRWLLSQTITVRTNADRGTRTFRKAPRRTRLNLEQLEDRVMPSTLGSYALLEGPSAGSDADIVATSGAWTATSNATWLHTSASGTGNGLASLSFDANSGATRTGTLTIAGLTLSVTQAGSTYVAANPVTTLVSSGLNGPQGVAVDGAGNVYIADSGDNTIEEWNATSHQVTTLVSGLANPQGVAVDGAGNVYIADFGTSAIKEWNATNHTVTTLASGLNNLRGVAVPATSTSPMPAATRSRNGMPRPSKSPPWFPPG